MGVAKDGRFVRTASPSFTLDYPKSMQMRPLIRPKQIFYGFYYNAAGKRVDVIIDIHNVKKGQKLEEAFQDSLKAGILWLQKVGDKPKVISDKPLHIYNGYKAREVKLDWQMAEFSIPIVYHLIEKEAKIISLSGSILLPTGKNDLKSALEIFKTIDLNPEIEKK